MQRAQKNAVAASLLTPSSARCHRIPATSTVCHRGLIKAAHKKKNERLKKQKTPVMGIRPDRTDRVLSDNGVGGVQFHDLAFTPATPKPKIKMMEGVPVPGVDLVEIFGPARRAQPSFPAPFQ